MGNFFGNTHNYPRFIVEGAKSLAYLFYKISERLMKPPFDKYDFQTFDLIKRIPADANCIDVGAHKADILRKILKQAPKGKHFAFEPIPWLYDSLQKRFGRQATIYKMALGDKAGEAEFFVFRDRPAVSGLKKRPLPENHAIEKINVEVETLDHVIPEDIPIHLIKIDVEGAEMLVLKGAKNILTRHKPLVLFECGIGGTDIYETTPENVFDFFHNIGFSLSLLDYYLSGKKPLGREEFKGQFEKAYNYFFIAYTDKN
jgi:FkbM family methyltransferase